jgi:hypothetical protein
VDALLKERLSELEARLTAKINSAFRREGYSRDARELEALADVSEFAENSEARWVALVARVEALEKRLEGK